MKRLILFVCILLSFNSFSQTTPWSNSPTVTPQTRKFNSANQIRWLIGASSLYSLEDTLTSRYVTFPYFNTIIGTATQSALNGKLSQADGDARYPLLSGSYTNPSWLNSLSWTKITSTPNTLSGYGITDGITTNTFNNTIGTATNDKIDGKVDTGLVHVFIIGGQSNAGPYGDSTLSPKITEKIAREYRNTGGSQTLRVANDPVGINEGPTRTGSMWPAFARAYYEATGIRIVFVSTYTGGASQVAAAENGTGGGNWDSSGTRYPNSIAKGDSAIAYLTSLGYKPVMKGILWSQGEQDGRKINEGVITKAQYKTALVAMIARYRSHYYKQLPFYIWRTGSRPAIELDAPGYVSVREVQNEVVEEDENTFMAADNALLFPYSGLMNADGSHYLQPGYNLLGVNGAAVVANSLKNNLLRLDPVTGYISSRPYSLNSGMGLAVKNVNAGVNSFAEVSAGSGINNSSTTKLVATGKNYLGSNFMQFEGGVIAGDSLNALNIIHSKFAGQILFKTGNVTVGSAPVTKAIIDQNGLHVGSLTPTTNIFDVGANITGISRGLFYNTSTASSSAAEVTVGNSTTANDGVRIQALGTGFTTAGLIAQDGGALRFGSGLSGGGVITAEASSATIRFGFAGTAIANLRHTFGRTSTIFATALTTQRTVGATTDSIATITATGEFGRVKTLSTSQIDTTGNGIAPKSYVNNFALKNGPNIFTAANTFTGQQTFLTTGNSTAINGSWIAFNESNFTTKRPRVSFTDAATTRILNIYPPDVLTVASRTIKLPDNDGTIALTSDLPTLTRLTGSGTGAATTISIPHGLSGITSASIAIVTPINAASAGISYITSDATNINIIYTVAPVNGTNNLSYNVSIKQ